MRWQTRVRNGLLSAEKLRLNRASLTRGMDGCVHGNLGFAQHRTESGTASHGIGKFRRLDRPRYLILPPTVRPRRCPATIDRLKIKCCLRDTRWWYLRRCYIPHLYRRCSERILHAYTSQYPVRIQIILSRMNKSSLSVIRWRHVEPTFKDLSAPKARRIPCYPSRFTPNPRLRPRLSGGKQSSLEVLPWRWS